jgi:hypothetical protein
VPDAQFAAADSETKPGFAREFALSVLFAVIGSVLADAVIALIARAAGASHAFQPLTPTAYIPLTVVGVLIGAIGWQVVRARAQAPADVLRWLVPAAVVVSFVPDIAVGAGHGEPGTSWGAVAALMIMHVAVATVAASVFRRVMPLR